MLEVEKLTPTADLDLNLTPSFLLLLEPKEKGSWLSVGPSIQKLSRESSYMLLGGSKRLSLKENLREGLRESLREGLKEGSKESLKERS